MQSAIRPEAPRIIDIKPLPNAPSGRTHLPRAASTSSVILGSNVVKPEIQRAASTSSVGSTLGKLSIQSQRRPNTAHSIDERPTTIHSVSYFIPQQLNLWKGGAKNKQEAVREKHSSQKLRDMQDSREHTLALAEFLKTKQPPPSNRMSHNESDEEPGLKLQSILGKLARRKSNSRKKREPRLIQLPDTAVAARTIDGHRHIAISIPVQYNAAQYAQLEDKPLPQAPLEQRSSSLPKGKTTKQQRGPVVVLKPVREVQESIGAMINPHSQNPQLQPHHKISRADSIQPAVESPVQNATQTFQNYEASLVKKQLRSSGGSDLSSELSMEEIEARNAAANILSDGSEPRNSNGTYSTSSRSTTHGHSRAKSSVSTVESCASINPGLSVQQLTPSRLTGALETELRAAARKLSAYDEFQLSTEYPTEPRVSTPEILCRELFDNPSSMDYDALARNNARVETIPPICPPPNRELPDLPPNGAHMRSLSSGSTRTNNTLDSRASSGTLSPRYMENDRLSRRESVRTKKKRDPTHVRERCSTPNSLRGASRTAALEKRRISDWEMEAMPQNNTDMKISGVMVVGDVSPRPLTPKYPTSSESTPKATPRSRRHTKTSSRTTISSPHHQALSLSNPIYSDLAPLRDRSHSQASHSSTSHSSPHELESLTSRRQARKAARNANIKDQAIEARLRRLEMDNKILLEALSGIAGGFGLLRNQGLLDRHGAKLELMGFGEGAVRSPDVGANLGANARDMGWRESEGWREGKGNAF